MRGTEKQLAWATEIQKTIIDILRECANHADADFEKDAEAVKSEIGKRIAAIEAAEYAGDLISLFKGIRKTGDYREDVSKVFAVYVVARPATAGERKILCK